MFWILLGEILPAKLYERSNGWFLDIILALSEFRYELFGSSNRNWKVASDFSDFTGSTDFKTCHYS